MRNLLMVGMLALAACSGTPSAPSSTAVQSGSTGGALPVGAGLLLPTAARSGDAVEPCAAITPAVVASGTYFCEL